MIIYNFKIDQLYCLNDEDIMQAYDLIKRWYKAVLERTKTDKLKAINIIERAYGILELPKVPIIYVEGMDTAIKLIKREFPRLENHQPNHSDGLNCSEYEQLTMALYFLVLGKNQDWYNTLSSQAKAISRIIWRGEDVFEEIYYGIYEDFEAIIDYHLSKVLDIEIGHTNNSYLQYCIEDLKIEHNLEAWDILKNLTQECPYIIPLSKLCIVIEYPVEIQLDNEQLPHAHNKPATIFGDGSKVYYHHGVYFPAKYGDIPISDWQPEWILSEKDNEYNRDILSYAIGYKNFRHEYPDYDFWQDRDRMLGQSIDIIINWQLYHYNQLYLKHLLIDELKINYDDAIKLTDLLPFKLPMELYNLYNYYNGGYQLAPDLYFYSLKQAIQALPKLAHIKSNTGYPFPLFKGDRGKLYYILADKIQATYSHIYCIFPGGKPMIYAECVTSLIVTIAQCYQEGCYHIETDRETGIREIKQYITQVEPIFEKFNPDRIDTWREISAN
jgi:hypothetical protein